jgi:excisionase family DNA binding protein
MGFDQLVLQVALRDVSTEVLDKIAAHVVTHLRAASDCTPQKPEISELLSTKEAAELLSVSPKTVRSWIGQGKLIGLHAGRCIRVRRADLMKLTEHKIAHVDTDALAHRILDNSRRTKRQTKHVTTQGDK